MTTKDKDTDLHILDEIEVSEVVSYDLEDFCALLSIIDEKIGLIVDMYYDYTCDEGEAIGAETVALGQDLGLNFKGLMIEYKHIIEHIFEWIDTRLDHLDFAIIIPSDDDMLVASLRLLNRIQYEIIGANNGKKEQKEEPSEEEAD